MLDLRPAKSREQIRLATWGNEREPAADTSETPLFRLKQGRFASGERFPRVIDRSGAIAFAPTEYSVHVLRSRELANSTVEAHLRAIIQALTWAEARKIDLQARFESLDLLSLEEVLDLRDFLRRRVRNNTAARNAEITTNVGSTTYCNRCLFVSEYLCWNGTKYLTRLPAKDAKLPDASRRLRQLRSMMLANLPKRRSLDREGIGEEEQVFFLNAIKPGNQANPFQTRHQERNYALLRLYYETGMRRAEALKLKGEHLIGLGGNHPLVRVMRAPDDKTDPRSNEPCVKTLGRDVPVSVELAAALLRWMEIRRDPTRYSNTKKTGFVFVARTGRPLSLRTVGDMFELLRARVRTLPSDLSAHLLRHTANDRFSAAVDREQLTEAQEKQARNYLMGWAKTSDQGSKYTVRHTRQRAQAIALKMQEKSEKGTNR